MRLEINKIFKIRCISHLCTPKLVQHRAKTERNRAANSFACIASTNQSERAGTVALLSPAFFISHNVRGLCVRCLCALARVSASNDAKPVLCSRCGSFSSNFIRSKVFLIFFLCGGLKIILFDYQIVALILKKYLKKYLEIQKECVYLLCDCNSAIT